MYHATFSANWNQFSYKFFLYFICNLCELKHFIYNVWMNCYQFSFAAQWNNFHYFTADIDMLHISIAIYYVRNQLFNLFVLFLCVGQRSNKFSIANFCLIDHAMPLPACWLANWCAQCALVSRLTWGATEGRYDYTSIYRIFGYSVSRNTHANWSFISGSLFID